MPLKMVTEPLVIAAENTDVMVLCIIFRKKMYCPVYQTYGTQTRTRYIDTIIIIIITEIFKVAYAATPPRGPL